MGNIETVIKKTELKKRVDPRVAPSCNTEDLREFMRGNGAGLLFHETSYRFKVQTPNGATVIRSVMDIWRYEKEIKSLEASLKDAVGNVYENCIEIKSLEKQNEILKKTIKNSDNAEYLLSLYSKVQDLNSKLEIEKRKTIKDLRKEKFNSFIGRIKAKFNKNKLCIQ